MKYQVVMALFLLSGFGVMGETIENMASSPETIAKWQNGKTVFTLLPGEGPDNSVAVRVASDNAKLQQFALYRFNRSDVIGKNIVVTCDVKGENIAKPEKFYMGIKFQLMTIAIDGNVSYFEQLPANYRFGSFDWKGARVTAKIPDKTKDVYLIIGLQNAIGAVYYANITCKVED